ncbi:hypothetical protein ASH00_04930 [Arthrobacter sp. Soil782]|uniref:DUF418 domain-containing protein n=1 Tax=Arthrobacter sp. Soil782 TaxID=1736410 RepID=UPI0006F6AC96|nr:DUF418 domain-containing protein [Arthrobacter sp. Soil782]KRF09017.1 hypothetical protein ASH00_04930 [Arthrobacter sp. Soil782]
MGSARLREVDALRSFALGGILMVNIWYFADPFTLAAEISPNHRSAADLAVRFTVAALFEAKFYLLFSFLFGYSFDLQWRAAIAATASPVQRMQRRLAALFVLGLLHGLVLFFGDILLTYALMGLILLATHSLRTSTAVITGSALIGGIGSLILAVGLFIAGAGAGAPSADIAVDPGALTQSPSSAFSANADNFLENVAGVVFVQGPLSLGMFYIGLAAARARLFERPLSTRMLTTTAATCLPVGLAAGVFQAYLTTYGSGDRFSVLAFGISTLTAPLQTAGYVSLLLLLFRTAAGARLCGLLAPAGRMALTNYLLQSVIMALVFTAYGLRLSDGLPASAVAGIAVVIFAAQLILSRLLLARIRIGPAEWLLRSITYGRRSRRAPGS